MAETRDLSPPVLSKAALPNSDDVEFQRRQETGGGSSH